MPHKKKKLWNQEIGDNDIFKKNGRKKFVTVDWIPINIQKLICINIIEGVFFLKKKKAPPPKNLWSPKISIANKENQEETRKKTMAFSDCILSMHCKSAAALNVRPQIKLTVSSAGGPYFYCKLNKKYLAFVHKSWRLNKNKALKSWNNALHWALCWFLSYNKNPRAKGFYAFGLTWSLFTYVGFTLFCGYVCKQHSESNTLVARMPPATFLYFFLSFFFFFFSFFATNPGGSRLKGLLAIKPDNADSVADLIRESW